MTDVFTKAKRSEVMSMIRGRDTKPERIVRSILHKLGYRFRLNRRDLPGSPDILLPRYQTAIFVHGCFWHRHGRCRFATMPKTRKKFWEDKFESNIRRDQKARKELRRMGWHVLTIWECELRHADRLSEKLDCVLGKLK